LQTENFLIPILPKIISLLISVNEILADTFKDIFVNIREIFTQLISPFVI